jgi:hypothetical protein
VSVLYIKVTVNLANHRHERNREDGTCPMGVENSENSSFHSTNE